MFLLVNQLRWVDIIVIIIVIRCIYVGIKRGFGVEIFKLAGTLLLVFTCLHYYSRLGTLISKPKMIPSTLGDFVAFFILFAVFSFFCRLIRDIFLSLVKLQPIEVLDKWGGAFLGGIRGIFLSGMVLLMLIISSVGFLDRGAKIAYFGIHTIGAAVKTYTFTVEKLVKPFFPEEELNQNIFEAIGE